MTIHVNGEPHETYAPTLGALLAQIGVDPARVAVEMNRAIVARDAFDATPLGRGDRIEVIRFVSGG